MTVTTMAEVCFYLSDDLALAKEWAVCRPNEQNGWIHAFRVTDPGLTMIDFRQLGVLAWMAELMKHREAGKSRRFNMLSQKFIAKYGVDSSGYDVIRGWRANASYFYIVTEFVHDEITNGGESHSGAFPVIYFLIRYVAPVAVLVIFISNLVL